MRAWSWSTRALWAYRQGDPQAAVNYLRKSEEEIANEFAHALNLEIEALAREKLGQLDEAREAIAGATNAIESLRRGPARGNDRVYHDVFIPLVLLREAQSRVDESTKAAN